MRKEPSSKNLHNPTSDHPFRFPFIASKLLSCRSEVFNKYFFKLPVVKEKNLLVDEEYDIPVVEE